MTQSTNDMPTLVRLAARILEYCGALLLFAMMALTFVDVIGRYAFSSPVPGGFEITEIMLASLIFCGLPLITLRDGHITVDLIENILPKGFRAWRDRFVFVASGIVLLYLCSRLWIKAGVMFGYNDQTAVLNIPLFPVIYAMCLLTGLSGLIAITLGVVGYAAPREKPLVDL